MNFDCHPIFLKLQCATCFFSSYFSTGTHNSSWFLASPSYFPLTSHYFDVKKRISVSSWYFCTTGCLEDFFSCKNKFLNCMFYHFFSCICSCQSWKWIALFYFFTFDLFHVHLLTLRVIQFKSFDSFFALNIIQSLGFLQREKTTSAKILHIKTTSAWYSTIFQKRFGSIQDDNLDTSVFLNHKCVLFFYFWGQFLVHYTIPDLAINCEEIYIGNLESFGEKGKNMSTNTLLTRGGTSIFLCLLDLLFVRFWN